MFFPRLRRQAKWMFVFLALVFGVGFVVFGVGGNLPGTGVADLFSGGGGTPGGQLSVSEARERIEENPKDPTGYQQLAQALQTDGRIDEAITPLEHYTRLRPKDDSALQQLAGLYGDRLARQQEAAQAAQLQAALAGSEQSFGTLRLPRDRELPADPITSALTTEANERLSQIYGELQTTARKVTATYKRLAKVSPDDPTVQIALAQAAEQAGDTPSALAAYRRFVRLAPDDPSTPIVKERIKQLGASSAAQG